MELLQRAGIRVIQMTRLYVMRVASWATLHGSVTRIAFLGFFRHSGLPLFQARQLSPGTWMRSKTGFGPLARPATPR